MCCDREWGCKGILLNSIEGMPLEMIRKLKDERRPSCEELCNYRGESGGQREQHVNSWWFFPWYDPTYQCSDKDMCNEYIGEAQNQSCWHREGFLEFSNVVFSFLWKCWKANRVIFCIIWMTLYSWILQTILLPKYVFMIYNFPYSSKTE